MQQQETEVAPIDTETLRRRLKKDVVKNSHKRQFQRHNIFAVASMVMMDNSLNMDGVVDEVSEGGLRFRPASTFIMERNNESVLMNLDSFQISGIIRATRADGYGVQLLDPLNEDQLEILIDKYQA